jgi:hypothetical protein
MTALGARLELIRLWRQQRTWLLQVPWKQQRLLKKQKLEEEQKLCKERPELGVNHVWKVTQLLPEALPIFC